MDKQRKWWVHTCPECGRRRRNTKQTLSNADTRWTCSKGHTWVIKATKLDEINHIAAQILLPGVIDRFFNNDVLMGYLKR